MIIIVRLATLFRADSDYCNSDQQPPPPLQKNKISHQIYTNLVGDLFWSQKGEFSPKDEEFASVLATMIIAWRSSQSAHQGRAQGGGPVARATVPLPSSAEVPLSPTHPTITPAQSGLSQLH